MTPENFLYGNNTQADLGPYHEAIKTSLLKDGTLPEALADLFVVTQVPSGNPDGSPRFMIHEA